MVNERASGFTEDLREEIPSQPIGIAVSVLERLRRVGERQLVQHRRHRKADADRIGRSQAFLLAPGL